jgi:hypothetical protein
MQKKKNQYKTPEMEIVLFEQEDIITASGESSEEPDINYGPDELPITKYN